MTRTQRIGYFLIKGVVHAIAALPFPLLYLLSDCVAVVMHRLRRYRLKVVRENLASAFPEKNRAWLRRTERKFYHWLADYFLETLKLTSMSETRMRRCLTVENPEMVDEAVAAGRSVTLLLGHYCNWEWVSSLPLHFAEGTTCAQVYHYLHNRAMDKVFMDLRTRFGAHNIEMGDIMRALIEWKRSGTPTVTGFIADQCPKWEIHLFVDFLNHETGVYTGPERIARFLDAEVIFCHLSRPRRGEYRLRFIKITDTPKKEDTFEITRRYMQLLQSNIEEAPQFWLWSHRRWKRTRADFEEYWGDQASRMLSHL